MSLVSPERQRKISPLIDFVGKKLDRGELARLIFICTHNSRRSHFAQVWSHVAADHFKLTGVRSYSGGTEVTECNPRTIESLRRSGFKITKQAERENPIYLASHSETGSSLELYSKRFDAIGNPQEDYAAVLCCTDAEKKCPTADTSAQRIGLYYDDPKISDDTPTEAETYDARSQEIAREMFFLMQSVSQRTTALPG